MTDGQRSAKALLETPEVFKYLSGNEIRVCEKLLEDPYFIVAPEGSPMNEEAEVMAKAIKADASTLKNLENTFPKEISQWKTANP